MIQPKTLTRTLAKVSVIPQPDPAGLSPSEVAVTVQGSWLLVKELKAADVQAWVDTRNLGPRRSQLQVTVILPPGDQPGTGAARLGERHPAEVSLISGVGQIGQT